ncbi:MAG: HipA N-terminal domain-containing protein [Candidatus Caenarcaniphilales bacterium]|nr:HipA N-terminal domain-containing protein [Candidatus Caenarcaniphilales bacterium]
MIRRGEVYYQDKYAGLIEEVDEGFQFTYEKNYLINETKPISLTMPLREEAYLSKTMIPFFDGLIPEGFLLNVAEENWKLNSKDRMGLLLACCRDCIGAVTIIAEDI